MREPRLLLIVTAVALSFGGSSQAGGDTLHVPGDFATIQDAIDAALDGDDVLVEPGAYPETLDLLGKAITVHSTHGPLATALLGNLSGTVISCISGETRTTVIKGFSITGGLASTGGGMHNLGSDPTIIDCIFTINSTMLQRWCWEPKCAGIRRTTSAATSRIAAATCSRTNASRRASLISMAMASSQPPT